MATITGVHLLPSTGEFTYDTVVYLGQRTSEPSLAPVNSYAGQAPTTDYTVAIEQLQAEHPECQCVSLVCSWFCDGTTAGSCHVYPSTTYVGGAFQKTAGVADDWRCSGLTQNSSSLIPIPALGSSYLYGGTPSDQSLVRCVQDLKARGFRVVFYPFLLLTAPGKPWRGRIGYSPDVSSAATAAVDAFLGSAAPLDFTRDPTNLTVAYAGSPTDWTYRRMILHYANLMIVAGGIDLFVIGSELRGLETIRGPAWTAAGTTDGSGHAIWDYPFVAGLTQLAADVRSVFDAAGHSKNLATLKNLVTYSADWSVWMGYQHPGENGQWPHLDSLYASSDIDLVSLDNYMPISDWTTGDGGLDAVHWQDPPPSTWPPSTLHGLGLAGAPTLRSTAYFQANIEGGEKFDWYYDDSINGGAREDPLGSGLIVSLPKGDRATQTREPYYAGQEILANKQVRWWWNTPHQAIYDTGSGWAPQGPPTPWVASSKSVIFLEYGFPACDKATNQPNVFFAPSSVESFTPFWSAWESVSGGGIAPVRDDTIADMALDAFHAYWAANNLSIGGVPLIQWTFCCAWNWDARPFPTFPDLASVWGDAGNWRAGNWISSGRLPLPPVAPSPDPSPHAYPTFPTLATLGWSVRNKPKFRTGVASHVSGRESRCTSLATAYRDVELTYDLLRADAPAELQTIAAFYLALSGKDGAFWFAPPGLSNMDGQTLGSGDGSRTSFPLLAATGGAVEPVQATSGVSAVYLGGVLQASGWSVSPGYTPSVLFATPPSAGVIVSADFRLLWLCRFAEDVADLENFMTLLWKWRAVKLQTTRP